MAILKEIESKAKYIKSVIDYVKKDAKTASGYYVEGINCDPQKATAEFIAVQNLWNKTDGRRYFHYVMSWNVKDNITPELALEIAKEWISKIAKLSGHQIILAAHLDQKHGNIHVHIVGNSVNMETGVKLHRNAAELATWKEICNEINLVHGFQPPKEKIGRAKFTKPTVWKKEEYKALKNAKNKVTCKQYIMFAISDAMRKATTKDEYIAMLAKKDITVVWTDNKKHITYTAEKYESESDTKKRTVRDTNIFKTFGKRCDKEAVEERLQINLQSRSPKNNMNNKNRLQQGRQRTSRNI